MLQVCFGQISPTSPSSHPPPSTAVDIKTDVPIMCEECSLIAHTCQLAVVKQKLHSRLKKTWEVMRS